ncbi:MAG TPA: hypothetical protein VFZ69_07280 [Longimicrobiales bacterium]
MSRSDVVPAWERLPEYRATQQLARSIGRILMSLPPRARRITGRALIRAPLLIARGIAGANAELPPGLGLTREERDEYLRCALDALELLRGLLRMLRGERLGSQPDLLVGLELLERIEQGLAEPAS